MPVLYNNQEEKYSEDIQDVMTKAPSWLLRWGISLFLLIMVILLLLSKFIRYPEVIKTQIKISSNNSPKPITCRSSGKLVSIMVTENQKVEKDQPMAYLESLATHGDVLALNRELWEIRREISNGKELKRELNVSNEAKFGEIQVAYENFSKDYLRYKSVISDGLYAKRENFIRKDMDNILLQKKQLQVQLVLLLQEYKLAKKEYEMHQKLTKAKVEAEMELQREESKLIAKQYPIQQMNSSLLSNSAAYLNKEKDLVELQNDAREEHVKFAQALNSLINETEDWKNKFILSASQEGRVAFVGSLQINKIVNLGEELFYIYPVSSSDFFGEMIISQDNMAKVRVGQNVLIKLNSYPFEEYGLIRGKITHIGEVAFRDSVFLSRVSLKKEVHAGQEKQIKFKNGLVGQAEVLTDDTNVMTRVYRSMKKIYLSR